LRFLDLLRYLAPGYTLRKFITAFAPEVTVGKSYFPYEYITNIEKLNEKNLPPYEAFFSSLTNSNVLEEEYNRFSVEIGKGQSIPDVLKTRGRVTIPHTGKENYENLKNMWITHNMKTLKDFLRYYLSQDLIPFLWAVQNMQNFYHERKIDVFINHSTLPSVTLPMLFSSIPQKENKPFLLLDHENHNLIRNSVLGALALTGTRWVECGKSKIKSHKFKEQALTVKNIVRFDFNSLYGGCLGTVDHYTGIYCIREKQNGYENEWNYESKTKDVTMWLKYQEIQNNYFIQSANNIGEKKITIGQNTFLLDGYNQETQTAFEYYGCYWHSHSNCKLQILNVNNDHPHLKQTHKENYTRSMRKIAILQTKFKNVILTWECEWLEFFKKINKLKIC